MVEPEGFTCMEKCINIDLNGKWVRGLMENQNSPFGDKSIQLMVARNWPRNAEDV